MNAIGWVGIIYLGAALLAMLKSTEGDSRTTAGAVFLGWLTMGVMGFLFGFIGAQ